MKTLFFTLLFCAFHSISYAQTSFDYSEIESKNLISESNQESLYKQNRLKINYSFLKPNRIAPKHAKVIGRILQGFGVVFTSNSLFLGFILYRFGSLGKENFYPLAGIFVAGGVIFYTGTRIVINSKKKIRENLLGMKNTSVFLKSQNISLLTSNSSPTIGVSFDF